MKLNTKIMYAKHINEVSKNKMNQIFSNPVDTFWTTNEIKFEKDRKYADKIIKLSNFKIIIRDADDNYVLSANLGLDFTARPFATQLYIARFNKISNINTSSSVGVEIKTRMPFDASRLDQFIKSIINNQDFEHNIKQFDDFIQSFEYYEKLSSMINDNGSYRISKPPMRVLYVPITEKGIFKGTKLKPEYKSKLKELLDIDKNLIGYSLSKTNERFFINEGIKVKTAMSVNINDLCKDGTRKIKRMSDSLYLTDKWRVNEKDIENAERIGIISFIKKDEILFDEFTPNEEQNYVQLYDIGQKIRVESVAASIRMIKNGASAVGAEMLSYLIGDNKMPTNEIGGDVLKASKKYTKNLNDSQKKAFMTAIDGSPITLIKGPPGTGKTHVITAITQFITREYEEKVIISSQTNVAIDNVLDKLMSGHDIIIPNRVASKKTKYGQEKIDETLYNTWGKSLITKLNNKDLDGKVWSQVQEDIKKFNGKKKFTYTENTHEDDFSVIGATTTTAKIRGKKGAELLKDYKWLIIDEVSKSPLPEIIRYLPYVDHVILVGDDYQLEPIFEIKKDAVRELEMYDEDKFNELKDEYEASVFANVIEKAEDDGRLCLLDENYRSINNVLETYNIFYDGKLKNSRTKKETVKFKSKDGIISKNGAYFIDVKGGSEQMMGTSRFNMGELVVTERYIKHLMKDLENPEELDVAVIFPYSAQIKKFNNKFRDLIINATKLFKSFEFSTVDAFQGKEADIVICNTVVTTSKGNFLNNFRRINVSMSRAKDLLIVTGNYATLKGITMDHVEKGRSEKFFDEIIRNIEEDDKYIEERAERDDN